jgi:hypothetical protein
VKIFENSAVVQVKGGKKPLLKTSQGQLVCQYAVLAGNVYLDQYGGLAPDLMRRIIPVGTYMIATEPMPKSRADALIRHRAEASDTNFVLDYFLGECRSPHAVRRRRRVQQRDAAPISCSTSSKACLRFSRSSPISTLPIHGAGSSAPPSTMRRISAAWATGYTACRASPDTGWR